MNRAKYEGWKFIFRGVPVVSKKGDAIAGGGSLSTSNAEEARPDPLA
jgi:hypothetical protein